MKVKSPDEDDELDLGRISLDTEAVPRARFPTPQ
jgi:hypothetical protein